MKMTMTFLADKVFHFRPEPSVLSCPSPRGPFSFKISPQGEISYKVKKSNKFDCEFRFADSRIIRQKNTSYRHGKCFLFVLYIRFGVKSSLNLNIYGQIAFDILTLLPAVAASSVASSATAASAVATASASAAA